MPVRLRKRARQFVLAALPFGLVGFLGCNTGAIGIAECRQLETARCDASFACGEVTDVAGCKRYVRDHCLHGIAGPSVPRADQQRDCLALITESGKCAEDDVAMKASACSGYEEAEIEVTPISGARAAKNVCDIVARPWDFTVCNYVNEAIGGSSGSN